MNIHKYRENTEGIIDFFYTYPTKLVVVSILSMISFVLFMAFSTPIYAFDVLTSSNILFGLGELYWLLRESSGVFGVSLTIIYSILFSVIMVTSYTQIRRYNRGFKNTLSVIPAVIFSGCAGCGTGVIALLGAAGVTSVLPFGGNLLRAGGIILMVSLLVYVGDPRED